MATAGTRPAGCNRVSLQRKIQPLPPVLRDPDDERMLEDAVQKCGAQDYHLQQKTFYGDGAAWSHGMDAGGIPEGVVTRPMSISVSVPHEFHPKAFEVAQAQHVSVVRSSPRRSPNNCPPGSDYNSRPRAARARSSSPHWILRELRAFWEECCESLRCSTIRTSATARSSMPRRSRSSFAYAPETTADARRLLAGLLNRYRSPLEKRREVKAPDSRKSATGGRKQKAAAAENES